MDIGTLKLSRNDDDSVELRLTVTLEGRQPFYFVADGRSLVDAMENLLGDAVNEEAKRFFRPTDVSHTPLAPPPRAPLLDRQMLKRQRQRRRQGP